jgi:hypothetical protein
MSTMQTKPEVFSQSQMNERQSAASVQGTAARGFAQVFGLHPIPAVMTLAVNAMLFTGELTTFGALIPLGVMVAIVLAVLTFICQRRVYGDDESEALVKALAVGLLTAIPTGLPSLLTVPSAAVGLIHTIRRKQP